MRRKRRANKKKKGKKQKKGKAKERKRSILKQLHIGVLQTKLKNTKVSKKFNQSQSFASKPTTRVANDRIKFFLRNVLS